MSYILKQEFISEKDAMLLTYYFNSKIKIAPCIDYNNPTFNNRIVYFEGIKDIYIRDLVEGYVKQIMEKLKCHYSIKEPIYPDSINLVKWETGHELGEHADAFFADGRPNYTPYRKYSSIVYLNQDFEGGSFEFTKGNCDEIQPETGLLVAFTAGLQDMHKVNMVKSGIRYTLACWFTDDPSKSKF